MKHISSFSALNAYASCPYHYYLKYVAKVKALEADYTGTFPGSCVHKAAELFFEWKNKAGELDYSIFGKENIKRIMHSLWDENTMHYSDSSFASNEADALEKITLWADYLRRMIVDNGCIKPVTLSEFRWGADSPAKVSERLLLIGGPDLCYAQSKDMPHTMIDFKNTESELHCSDHQLMLYVIATENTFNVKIPMAAFFLVKAMKPVWKVVTEDKKRATLNWAHQILDGIEAKKFEPSASKAACRLCPYRIAGCPHTAFSETSTKTVSKIKSLKELRSEMQSTKAKVINNIPEL